MCLYNNPENAGLQYGKLYKIHKNKLLISLKLCRKTKNELTTGGHVWYSNSDGRPLAAHLFMPIQAVLQR